MNKTRLNEIAGELVDCAGKVLACTNQAPGSVGAGKLPFNETTLFWLRRVRWQCAQLEKELGEGANA